eukprot:5423618-Pleurochrysis_carterae.AAC.7
MRQIWASQLLVAELGRERRTPTEEWQGRLLRDWVREQRQRQWYRLGNVKKNKDGSRTTHRTGSRACA